MAHELEIVNGVTSMAFAGQRKDIWHQLGQQFDGGLMTAEQAMVNANMDREVYAIPAASVPGMDWGVKQPNYIILDGKSGITPEGELFEIPAKIVGVVGDQAAAGNESLSVTARFELAEEAIHASHGEAVWSTAGYIRNGTQGFATMEAPPTVIDPNGIADITRNYMTVQWSYDGSIGGAILGASNIRVVCANTLACHNGSAQQIIKVKMTSGAYDRMKLAAEHWAMAQDASKALALQGERMIAIPKGERILVGLAENVLGWKIEDDMSKRAKTIRANKMQELRVLYHAPTNLPAIGDNGYAAFQTVVEYLDWFSPVKGEDQDTERIGNQFDGTYAAMKQQAADYVLSMA
jgi:hypothetical protein